MLDENWLIAFATLIGDRLHDIGDDLSPSARALLLSVEHRQPITVSEAAAVLAISQPTATRLADGLQAAGLLHRGAKTERAVPLLLTAEGRRKAADVTAAMQARAADLLDVLDPVEREAFTAAIAKILAGATGSRRQAWTICRYCDHGLCDGADCPVGSRAGELEAQADASAGA